MTDQTDFNLKVSESLARIEIHLENLSGPDGRVHRLEKIQERQWWFSVGIAPVLTILHALARKLNLNL